MPSRTLHRTLTLLIYLSGSIKPKSFAKSFDVSCVSATQSTTQMVQDGLSVLQRPDSFVHFGKYGGKYVPESLMLALSQLESAFKALATDHEFQITMFQVQLIVFLPLFPIAAYFVHRSSSVLGTDSGISTSQSIQEAREVEDEIRQGERERT